MRKTLRTSDLIRSDVEAVAGDADLRDLGADHAGTRAEANSDRVTDTIPDAMIGVNAGGRIEMVNTPAERLFGYRRDELIGRPVEVLVPGSMRSGHVALRHRYLADPRPRPLGAHRRLAARRKDGTVFPAQIALAVVGTPAGPLVLTSVREAARRGGDSADHGRARIGAERQHRQGPEPERLPAGDLAQEVGNLLAVIENYASFITEDVAAALEAEEGPRWDAVGRDIRQVRMAAERAAELTRRLLASGGDARS